MKSTDIEYAKHFSANVKYLIALKGKQQQEIATELGYKPTTFYNWCAGRIFPSFRDLQRIAEYFHVNPEDLVHPLVGGEVMFNERLYAEEMKMIEAFRAASPAERSRAMAILQGPTLSVVPEREELMKLIAQSQEDSEELLKSIAENIERINSRRIRPLTPAQQLKMAVDIVHAKKVGKKEGGDE